MKSFFFWFIAWITLLPSAYASNGVCKVQESPSPGLVNYVYQIRSELNSLQNNTDNTCEGQAMQNAAEVIQEAESRMPIFSDTVWDFDTWLHTVSEGKANSPVMRDIIIFDQIENEIIDTVYQLADTCGLSPKNSIHIQAIIQENRAMRIAFQESAQGLPSGNPRGIREHIIPLWEEMTYDYTPFATVNCDPQNMTGSGIMESLRNSINFGGGIERGLEWWRKGMRLLQWGGRGMSVAEYTAYQRRLLSAELSRQWLTANSRDAILANFDCFKMHTQNHTSAADMVRARVRCVQNPILGINRLFAPWATAIARSSTIYEYTSYQESFYNRHYRTTDIAEKYAELNALISPRESEVNIHTVDNLIDLHISIMSTNEALEKRIRPMQNNCMKWQPNIVGACR